MASKKQKIKITKIATQQVAAAQEESLHQRARRVELRNNYLTNTVNANYWTAHANMLADQIANYAKYSNHEPEKIGKLDGVMKTKEYLCAEFNFYKLRVLNARKTLHFSKEEIAKLNVTEEDLIGYIDDFLENPAKRDEYPDEESEKFNKSARFIG